MSYIMCSSTRVMRHSFLTSVGFEHSVCHESLPTSLIYAFIYIHMCAYVFIYLYTGPFRRGIQAHTHMPAHEQKCLDV